ncbi:MAG: hypothetical protein QOG89_576, partial [Thermomicrobiales bacterium]|nr:hypothetical protein [Thermomicrobiales bacterium]
TLLVPGAQATESGSARQDLAYLPSPVVRAPGERRIREITNRAS